MAILDELFGAGAGQPMPADAFNAEALLRAIQERLTGNNGVLSSVAPGPERPPMAPIKTTEVKPRPQPGVPYRDAPATTGSMEPTAGQMPNAAPQPAPAAPIRITRPADDRTIGERFEDFFAAGLGKDTKRQRETENLTVKALTGKKIGDHVIDEPLAWAIARNPTAMKMILPSVFGNKLGVQPIFGTDEQGNTVIGQIGPNGQLVQTKLPTGFKVGAGLDKIDLGHEVMLRNKKTGAEVDRIAKDPKLGMQPVYGRDAAGRVIIGQMSSDGRFVPAQMPEGFSPAVGVDKVDLGQAWALIDKKSGAEIGRMPKDPKLGLEPIFGTDANGRLVLGQMASDGKFVQTQMPANFTPAAGIEKVDAGTDWKLIDKKTGATVGTIAKDIRGKEREEELGKQEGQKPVLFKKADATLKGLEQQHRVVLQDIDRALPLATYARAGFASLSQAIPGSPAHNLAKLLDTIKANVGFDKLQAMREASPTGGALGQVSDFENRLLQSVLGSLEQSQDPAELKFNLQRLKATLGELQRNRRDAFQRDFGGLIKVDPAEALAQARAAIAQGAPAEAVRQRLRQRGIDPGGL